MRYFNVLQCYKPKNGVIDSPIRIEEVALLQDPVDKRILARVKLLNQSQENIIAVFIRIQSQDISGEEIITKNEKYIYQDMIILPAELYGNKIAIELPSDVRKIEVSLDKIVFENGNIWRVLPETICEVIPQKIIEIPEIYIDQVRTELEKEIGNIEYVKYMYEESELFWECTCGKINKKESTSCSFCENKKIVLQKLLQKDKIAELIQNAKREIDIQNEIREKEIRLEKEKKERERQKELQERKIKWEKAEQERKIKEQAQKEIEDRRKKRSRIIIAVVLLAALVGCSYGLIVLKKNTDVMYQEGIAFLEQGYLFRAEKKFKGASVLNKKAKEKLEEVWELQIQQKKDELIKYGYPETFSNILCYLGKSLDFVKKNSDITFIDDKKLDKGYLVQDNKRVTYILKFTNNNLTEIVYPWSTTQHEIHNVAERYEGLFGSEYELDYGEYIWHFPAQYPISKVSLSEDAYIGYSSSNTGHDYLRYTFCLIFS